MSDLDCVQVAIRIRPLVESEINQNCNNVVKKTVNEPQILVDGGGLYTFNHVFTPDDNQEIVYSSTALPMLNKLFEGYNVTILAYGQTGSGKTHTMGTNFDGTMDENMGVIPRAVTDIFNTINKMTDHDVTVNCSFMELYQEQLYDLLNEKPREQSLLDIREDASKKIIIPGLTEIKVDSPMQTINCLTQGSRERATGATAMNAVSSRSHAIFTITIRAMKNSDPNGMITARFHLVDLAGSERSNKTKATGKRFQEGVKINQGLLTLGNVISALGSGQNRKHISYRDSKLTRLLQDSLGGNSVTLMIVCVSPADYNIDETISALRYADRAKQIKNKPIINQDSKAAELIKLNLIIEKLKQQLSEQNGQINGNGHHNISSKENDQNSLNEINRIKNEINLMDINNTKLQHQIQTALFDVVNIETRAALAESLKADINEKIIELKNSILDLNSTFDQETCPAEFYIHKTALNEIQTKINNLEMILDIKKDDTNLIDFDNNSNLNLDHESISIKDTEQKIQSSTTKQLAFSVELKKLNKELAVKEALYKKFLVNIDETQNKNNDTNKQLNDQTNHKNYEEIIQKLEKTRNSLAEKLKQVKTNNVTAKLAEERRKKLQELDHEIADMKKKNLLQSKIIKSKEKDSAKITILENQIRELKNTREKLVNSMKQENNNFQLWKKVRERELNQLKDKEEKGRTKLNELNILHAKQQNALKRKVEEANSIKNKLKEALDKQKCTKTNNSIPLNDRIKHELDVILSIIDAKTLLDQLMEDRGIVHLQLQEMKTDSTVNSKEIIALEDHVDLRNAQIADLREKTISLDVDEKIKIISDNISSLSDFKTIFKHVLTTIIEMKESSIPKICKYDLMHKSLDLEIKNVKTLEREIDQRKHEYDNELNLLTTSYEDKISVLLRELNKPKNSDVSFNTEQENVLDQIDLIRNEMDEIKMKNNELKRKINDHNIDEMESDDLSDNSENIEPNKKSIKKKIVIEQKNISKSIHCACKGNCRKKMCKCQKNNVPCGSFCNCSDLCENVRSSCESDDDVENVKEELPENYSPKRMKLSNDKLDVTTPSYPHDMKQRKPIFSNYPE